MKDQLFYDGNCSLCAAEIRWLKRLKDESLELIDIHSPSASQLLQQKSRNDLLSVLHLKVANGDWLTGLDATVTAWRHTYVGWLLVPLRWPLINSLSDRMYYHWANKRACRLGYAEQPQTKPSD